MTDMFDRASDLEEKMTALANAYRKPTLPLTGYCHYCSEECVGHFCDADCRSDYEKFIESRKRNGEILR